MTKPTPDQAIAAELKLPVEAIHRQRLAWNEDVIMRAVFSARLAGQIEERRKQLETVAPEDLKTKQGEIAGLKMAAALITKIET